MKKKGKMLINLTEHELEVIENALTEYWKDANEKLNNNGVIMYDGEILPLEDFEKRILKDRKKYIVPILERLENLSNE